MVSPYALTLGQKEKVFYVRKAVRLPSLAAAADCNFGHSDPGAGISFSINVCKVVSLFTLILDQKEVLFPSRKRFSAS